MTVCLPCVPPAAAEWEDPGDGLYLAVHDFPSQQDTQLPLTPGDVVEVQERADNGWWRGVLQGGDRSGWFPSGFVEPLQPGECVCLADWYLW